MSEIKFGTDGWRAVMCDTFIFQNVGVVAQAVANYIKKKEDYQQGIVIGYDTRFFSERFASLCAQIFIENKIPVYLGKDPFPTPVIACAIKKNKACGAVMITASHNPPEYNGIKFIPSYAGPASPKITTSIEQEIKRVSAKKGGKKSGMSIKSWDQIMQHKLVKPLEPTDDYIKQLQRLVDFEMIKKTNIKAVLDPMYGAGLNVLPEVFRKNKLKSFAINNQRDPLFGGSMPDPNAKNLKQLRKLVIEKKADVGLALDGDGDRFGFIDGLGVVLSPNQILTLLAVHLIKNHGMHGTIVRTVATTHALDAVAKYYGMPLVETPVGFKHIAVEMLKNKVVLGGEESGGLSVYGHVPEKDGILADLLLTEMTAYEKKPLSQVLKNIYKKHGYYYSLRIDLHYPQDKKEKLLQSLKTKPPRSIAGLPVKKVNSKDGVKLLLSGGSWLLIRPSGTEPLIRIYIESLSRKKFTELKKAAVQLTKT